MMRSGQRCQVKLSRPHVEVSPPGPQVLFKCAFHLGFGLDAKGEKRRPAHRCVVERTLAWLSKCRATLVRYDKKASNYVGLV